MTLIKNTNITPDSHEFLTTSTTFNPETHPDYERQLQLEARMIDSGLARQLNKNSTAKAKGRESRTTPGTYLIKQAIDSVTKGLDDFIAEAQGGKPGRRHSIVIYLTEHNVSTEMASFIALRTCIDTISRRVTLQNLAAKIGKAIEVEARLTAFAKQTPQLWQEAQEMVTPGSRFNPKSEQLVHLSKIHNIDFPAWPLGTKAQIGMKMIELIIAHTNYFKKSAMPSVSHNQRDMYTVEATEACADWLRACQDNPIFQPQYMPSIMPPKPWTTPFDGGYYLNMRGIQLVKTQHQAYLQELAARAHLMPDVYTAVNALQNTGYTLNTPVLEVLETLWDAGGGVAGLPALEDRPLPLCPACGQVIPPRRKGDEAHPCFEMDEHKAAMKTWVLTSRIIRTQNSEDRGQRFQLAKIIYMANEYRNEDVFYYPYRLDFRGRAYCIPSYLTPQGPDYAKGLLLFHQGKALSTPESVRWLAIHGANTFGYDKVSMADRVAFIQQNEARIRKVAQNPYEYQWWQEADEPWQFLAFCYEWDGYCAARDAGKEFISRLPVGMDGSCNGIQIFSLLVGDAATAKLVNVLPSDTPQDIYKVVADKVIAHLHRIVNDPEAEDLTKQRAANILELGLDRKATKRQVMVLPYGGTPRACLKYTVDYLLSRAPGLSLMPIFNNGDFNGTKSLLSSIIWEHINETVISAQIVMNFLQSIATKASKRGVPITWTNTLGMPILQSYPNYRSFRLETRLGDSIIKLTLREAVENSLDKSRQRLGVAPNFIHSLDASAMMLSIVKTLPQGISSFLMVHDCYAVPAADAAVMARALRQVFVDLFANRDVLAKFRAEMAHMIGVDADTLPPLPEYGELDVSQLMDSEFFFA